MTSIEGEPTTTATGEPGTEHATVQMMQRQLGQLLALHRQAAGLSQPELADALGRTRTAISKVEHGHRTMPGELWTLADQACNAGGALLAEHDKLKAARHAYRDRCQAQHRQAQQHQAQAELHTRHAAPAPAGLDVVTGDTWLAGEVHSARVGEFMDVVQRLVRTLGRRQAIQTIGWALGALGISAGLDPDEYVRVARAVTAPSRVDAQVINNLAAVLAYCKRVEDQLGPGEIINTVQAQHELTHRLLQECPDTFIKPLTVIDSTIASTIGTCLTNMGLPHNAKKYFDHARRAGHDAANPACAAYAAANAAFAAFLLRDTPTALDTAAATRSLAARTHDVQLQALAEQMAAAAHALDGQYQPCLSATGRAHDLLTHTNASTPQSPAYWVHHGTIDSQRSLFLCLLNKPKAAVDAASTARDQFNRTFAGSYARCHIRLGHALALSNEITEASQILTNAASLANLGPRLVTELHTARSAMQPWNNTPAVKALDEQLHTHGLLPNHKT